MSVTLGEGSNVGRYTLRTHLAHGGMADVWLANARGAGGFQKDVVIKTILPRLADDPDFVRMFIEEALVAAKLSHPNVIQLFDLGESNGSYFIAMEYIAGRTLRQVHRALKKNRRVPPPWFVLQVASSACDGLHHAHTMRNEDGRVLGLVHRDVNPENIMVAFTGETKVVDFGISKASTGTSKTRTGVLKGKHAYMAPEQIEGAVGGAGPDARSDVYAMGVVLYELLGGKRPYREANDLALMRAILAGEARPLHEFCPWISEPLSALVAKAMARDVNDRYQTALALRRAIDAYFRSEGMFPGRGDVAEYMAGWAAPPHPPAASSLGDPVSPPSPPPRTERAAGTRSEQAPSQVDEKSPWTLDVSVLLSVDEETEARAEEVDRLWSEVGRAASDRPVVEVVSAKEWDGVQPNSKTRGKTDAPEGEKHFEQAGPREVVVPEVPVPASQPDGNQPGDTRDLPSSERGISSGSHTSSGALWDMLTQRAREAKEAAIAERQAKAGPESDADALAGSDDRPRSSRDDEPSHSSGWDLVVSRIRRSSGPRPEAPPSSVTPARRAVDWFDEGLERWKELDLEGTLHCWTKAVELDPDNGRYRSNMRMLERRLSDRGDDQGGS